MPSSWINCWSSNELLQHGLEESRSPSLSHAALQAAISHERKLAVWPAWVPVPWILCLKEGWVVIEGIYFNPSSTSKMPSASKLLSCFLLRLFFFFKSKLWLDLNHSGTWQRSQGDWWLPIGLVMTESEMKIQFIWCEKYSCLESL